MSENPTTITRKHLIEESDSVDELVQVEIRAGQKTTTGLDEDRSTQHAKKKQRFEGDQPEFDIPAHPLLSDTQSLDGINPDDANSTPLASMSDEARRELQNELNYQHQKKLQQQLGNQASPSPSPFGRG